VFPSVSKLFLSVSDVFPSVSEVFLSIPEVFPVFLKFF